MPIRNSTFRIPNSGHQNLRAPRTIVEFVLLKVAFRSRAAWSLLLVHSSEIELPGELVRARRVVLPFNPSASLMDFKIGFWLTFEIPSVNSPGS
jgi:hypothetical protein